MQDATQKSRLHGPAAGGLGLPMQSAPIDRTPAGIALATGSGVEAAGWLDWAKKIGGGILRSL